MNKLFTKIAALFVGSLMAVGVGVALGAQQEAKYTPAFAESPVTFNYANCSEDMTDTQTKQTSTLDVVTFEISSGTLQTSGSYEFRIYKNKTATFTVPQGYNITRIVFTCTAKNTSQYGPGCFEELDGYTYSNYTGTWEGSKRVVTFNASENQVRATSIVVSFGIVPQTENDKMITPSSFEISGTGYVGNDGNHSFEGVVYTTSSVSERETSGPFQFRGNSGGKGKLFNAEKYVMNSTDTYIKSIILFMNSTNEKTTIKVYEGTSLEPDTEVTVYGGTFSTTGVNYYSFSDNMTYFKIANTSSGGAVYIDKIAIELADNATSSLAKARTAASHILSALDGKCGTGGTGNVTNSDWSSLNAQLTEDLGDDSTAKSLLKKSLRIQNDDLNSDFLTIESAMFRYDYCVEKFGFTPNNSISSGSSRITIVRDNNFVNSSNTIEIAIVVSSAIGASAIGLFFFMRKRKEDR